MPPVSFGCHEINRQPGFPWLGVPAGVVEQQHRVRAGRDGSADLLEVGLHGVGVGERHGERGTGSPRRTDGAATPMCGPKRA